MSKWEHILQWFSYIVILFKPPWVSRAMNVLVACCWVWAKFLGTRFGYSSSCSFLFLVLDIYRVFPAKQIYRKLAQWNQFSNILWKYGAVSRSYAVGCWHHAILTYFKLLLRLVTTVFYIFDVSSYCILCSYVEIDNCGKLFVAWKNIYERDFF